APQLRYPPPARGLKCVSWIYSPVNWTTSAYSTFSAADARKVRISDKRLRCILTRNAHDSNRPAPTGLTQGLPREHNACRTPPPTAACRNHSKIGATLRQVRHSFLIRPTQIGRNS